MRFVEVESIPKMGALAKLAGALSFYKMLKLYICDRTV